MNRKGVLYDVGRVLGINWRPVFDPVVVRRELQIIRDDLHCTAVKVCGRDLDRLTSLDTLQRLLTHGKPVVVTELGMRTYEGADRDGNLGTGIADPTTAFLHLLPLFGRVVRARTSGHHVRDEALQARRIVEDLTILDTAGVDGAFVCTFLEPRSTYDPDPRFDLDMGALSLVKTFASGHGTAYPDLTWEPKKAFHAVADFYGQPATPR